VRSGEVDPKREGVGEKPRSVKAFGEFGVAPRTVECMRLQRYLAQAGLGSRRRAEELIAGGRVCVDGVVSTLGQNVESGAAVTVDGRVVAPPATKTYVVLNKPVGVVTTMRDPAGRR
jgi:23S rRNA pseudouridine2605 synthase